MFHLIINRLVKGETFVSYLNTDSYLKFSPYSENDIGFAMVVRVFKQMALEYFCCIFH